MDGAAIKFGARVSTDRGWIGAALVFAALAMVIGGVTWPTLPDMASIWAGASTYHHGFFVAPAALWMITARGDKPRSSDSSTAGLFIVLAGALLWLVGRAGGVSLVEQAAFITILIGFIGAAFGDGALRAWVWPLAFLYFMVPAGDSLLPVLQLATAEMVVGALRLIGYDIAVDGILIHTPVGAFAVAEACAGLNVLIAAVMLAAAFGYVSFSQWSRRIAFMAFAAALAIVANAVRAFFLILYPLLIGKQVGIGPDHYFIGWALYAVVLIALAYVGKRFANAPVKPESDFQAPPVRILPIGVAVLALAASAVYAAQIVERPVDRTAPSTLSLFNASGWRILPPPHHWPPVISPADRTAAATYAQDEARIAVALSYFTHDRRGAEITAQSSPADSHWRRIGGHDAVIYLFGGSQTRQFEKLRDPQGAKYLSLTTYWLGDDVFDSARALKLAQAKTKLRGENLEGGRIILAAPYTDDPGEAVKAIGRFSSDVEKFSDWRARLAGR